MAKNYENQNKNCKNAQNSTNKAGKSMTDSQDCHSSSKYSSKNKTTDEYEDEEETSKY